MPLAQERALKRVAKSKGLTGKRRDAFVYGSLRRTGWRPSRESSSGAHAPDPAAATDLDRHNTARQQAQEAAARASSY